MIKIITSNDKQLICNFMGTCRVDSSSEAEAEAVDNDALFVNMTAEAFTGLFNTNIHKLESMYDRIYFTMNGKHINSFMEVAADLEVIKSNNNLNIYLLTEDRFFIDIEHTELINFFVRLNHLLTKTKGELYFFIYGQNIDSYIKPLMNSLCSHIESFSTLYTNNINQDIYKVIFKHTKQGIVTNKTHKIPSPSTHFATGLKKGQTDNKTPIPYIENGDGDILTTVELLKKGESLPPQYQAFKNKSVLFKEAKSKKHALIIFPCQSHHDIDRISKLTFKLRVISGNKLKIIVREVNCSLRYIDKIFLFESGVNLVIPSLLPFSELINLCYQVKRIPHQVSDCENYNDLTYRKPKFNTHGIFNSDEFMLHVKSLSSYHTNHRLDFALIKLKPLTDITAEQCLSLCHINRDGDLLTVCENTVYIFLSTVRLNDIDQALCNIFNLKADLLFTEKTIISNKSEVNIELSKIKVNSTQLNNISQIPNMKQRILYNKSIAHHYAKRTPLERAQHKVSS